MPAYTSDTIALGIIAEGSSARTDGPDYLQHPAMTKRGIIIALATAIVESGLKMYANNGDPDSLRYPHDDISYDYNSVGVFQQRAEWWGTVQERMDVRLSAAMFYHQLARRDYNNPRNSPGSQAQEVQGSAFPDRYDQHIAEAQNIYDRLASKNGLPSKETIVEKVLPYSRNPVGEYDGPPQQRSWDCGPASAQIILHACGINKSEQWLIDQIGTTVDGTNSAEYITPVLNKLLPGSGYTSVWLSREPVTKAQVEKLWADVKRSIDGNRGVILNFEAPPNNFPRGTRGDTSPAYRGGNTIFHYTAGMGYADDGPGGRHILIADPGFSPFNYWCSLEQVASLIVPHAYAYAATAPIATAPTKPPVVTPPVVITPPPTQPVDQVAELSAKVDRLSSALTLLLQIIERTNPEILRAYLNATKGQ